MKWTKYLHANAIIGDTHKKNYLPMKIKSKGEVELSDTKQATKITLILT